MTGNGTQTQTTTMADLPDAPLVLVVDDDPRARKLVSIVLRHAGYRVTTAEDARAALAALDEATPDAVVADLMMPGMNGIELLEEIRRRTNGATPTLVLLTAMDTADTCVAAQTVGVDAVMVKPFDRVVFLQRLGELLQAGGK